MIQFLAIEGDPEELGSQYGSVVADAVDSLFEQRVKILLAGLGASALHRLQRTCSGLWEAFRINTHTVWREVDACRQVVGLAGWQMIVAGAYTDVADLMRLSTPNSSECSVALDHSRGLIYGTWDSHVGAADCSLVLQRTTNDVSIVSLTTAGWPVQFGINSFGVAFGVTNLVPVSTRNDGLVYTAAVGHIASMRAVEDSLLWLKSQGFASGHSYLMLDSKQGRIAETSGGSLRSRSVIGGRAVQCNHYSTGLDDNRAYAYLEGSLRREREIDAEPTPDSFEHFAEWLGSNSCVLRTGPASPAVTSAFFLIDVPGRTLHVEWPDSGERIIRTI